jgi:hypothetical protein
VLLNTLNLLGPPHSSSVFPLHGMEQSVFPKVAGEVSALAQKHSDEYSMTASAKLLEVQKVWQDSTVMSPDA